jgi:hypothetical protein
LSSLRWHQDLLWIGSRDLPIIGSRVCSVYRAILTIYRCSCCSFWSFVPSVAIQTFLGTLYRLVVYCFAFPARNHGLLGIICYLVLGGGDGGHGVKNNTGGYYDEGMNQR